MSFSNGLGELGLGEMGLGEMGGHPNHRSNPQTLLLFAFAPIHHHHQRTGMMHVRQGSLVGSS